MFRAIRFTAVCGAVCGAALGSHTYYGGWPQPFGKHAVWLKVWLQPDVGHQLKPCCTRHGGKIPCNLDQDQQEFSRKNPLSLNTANIIETEHPECAQNLLCKHLLLNHDKITSCIQLTYEEQTPEKRMQLDLPAWILRELGVAPPSPNTPHASILAYDMLEDCLRFLPAGVCIVIHDWGNTNTIPLSSNFWILQTLCEKTNVTMVIIERKRIVKRPM